MAAKPSPDVEVGLADLIAFLQARIAEDEAAARERSDDDFYFVPAGPAFEVVDIGPGWVLVARPDRVLAECEAKRRVVEAAVWEVKDARRRPGWTMPDSEVDEKGRDYRVGYENARAHLLPDTLDRTERLLRLLALPYADHPDWREEWRP